MGPLTDSEKLIDVSAVVTDRVKTAQNRNA